MTSNWLKQLILFVVLVLLQVLVLNHILFLKFATPFLYIYFILKMPLGTNRNLLVFLGFILGLVIDIFCNTLGVNAAATTLTAFICYPIQRLFFDREDFENFVPSLNSLGASFIKYAIVCVFIHHAALISLSCFSYLNPVVILLRILSSTLFTAILIYAIEGFSVKRKKHE
ncbi:rod shape-determining protein MreD [Dysgonomonas macrotermitis]|uniref:Rod shape-determining protein MreD n=1 Tax=Dysgonomonas macrotermitis TaxID=1346286 RepID=A0A1M5AMH8_9BACT|nr:rod shape-determining protein MreD [Dysgonomonas macrotermitis]SHF31376.1 rod shape-determining protein MreD [Dysgonomonas macrotermitis]